jgi:hypothetical protein
MYFSIDRKWEWRFWELPHDRRSIGARPERRHELFHLALGSMRGPHEHLMAVGLAEMRSQQADSGQG